MVADQVCVLLRRAHTVLDLKEERWRSPAGRERIKKASDKEVDSLLKRIFHPRLALRLRNENGQEEVKCGCALQGTKDPDIIQLVRDGKTASPTLSTNGRALQVL